MAGPGRVYPFKSPASLKPMCGCLRFRSLSYLDSSPPLSLVMEQGKKLAATESRENFQRNQSIQTPKIANFSISSPFNLPLKKKPRSLVSLCLGLVGQHFEDIIGDLINIASTFPPDIKLSMMAIAKRRQLLNDDVLIALADDSWELLDISESDVSDSGLAKAVHVCTSLRAVDISRCENVTAIGVSELLCHCRSLEVLRCGGSRRSDSTARRCLGLLKPVLNDMEEESWEELDSMDISNGAHSLRWLVWPKIDEDSKASLDTECPRIIVNPQPSITGFHGVQVPEEALASVALDHSILEDIDPRTWAIPVGAAARRALISPASADAPEIPMAERFRLAFLERDMRMAPKRAKNERQKRRRMQREKLMNSADAKSVILASQAIKFLNLRS